MVINELIRESMMDNKKTITDIANGTGYSIQRITDIVLYDHSPTTKEALRIFDELGVDFTELLR